MFPLLLPTRKDINKPVLRVNYENKKHKTTTKEF
jgi:hypothetical protein